MMLFILFKACYGDFSYDFSLGGTTYADSINANTAVKITTAGYKPVVDSTFGALFQGENVGCSDADANSHDVGGTETITMRLNVFDPVPRQYVYCEYYMDVVTTTSCTGFLCGILGGTVTTTTTATNEMPLCIYIENGNLCVYTRMRANLGFGNTNMKTETNCLAQIRSGWSTIAVSVGPCFLGLSTCASAIVKNEATCGFTSGSASGLGFDFDTDKSFYHCLGAQLTNTDVTLDTYTAQYNFAGIIAELAVSNDGISNAYVDTKNDCGTCTGNCNMCAEDGNCPNTKKSSLIASYDFTKSAGPWSGTQAVTGGAGTPFTIGQDWMVATPYYVADQGLYFDTTADTMCNSGSFNLNWNVFSMGFWFKQTTAGKLLSIQTAANVPVFTVTTTGTGFTIAFGGQTYTMANTITANTWYYAMITVEKVSATMSQVCVNINYQRDATCVSTSKAAIFTAAAANKICIGGGYIGAVKSLDIFNMPLSNEEAKSFYKNGGSCTGGCTNCPTTGTCFSNCKNNQYGYPACTDCFYSCSSCFGATGQQCFSCTNDTVLITSTPPSTLTAPEKDYVYATTSCPACGDNYIDGSAVPIKETCDDGIDPITKRPVGGDGCSQYCQVEQLWTCTPSFVTQMGPSVCTFSCIDSTNHYWISALLKPFQKKPCDDGNLVNNDGCNQYCSIEVGWTCTGGTETNKDTCTAICGDGHVYSTEVCDDGNNQDGDGCSSLCKIESGYTCKGGSIQFPSICTTGCVPRSFDDGSLPCQDNNGAIRDGCNGACEVEKGWECVGGFVSAGIDRCSEVCGDSYNFKQYGCDDGNVNYLQLGNDGCAWATGLGNGCTVDSRYTCAGGTDVSRDKCEEICGDGFHMGNGWWNYLNANECDDGNQRPGDGCDGTCRLERGWTCTGGSTTRPDVCTPICGDWAHMDAEFCDDGNNVAGDGCDANCFLEVGMQCAGGNHYARDFCSEVCGDGRNVGYYICDDGNNNSGDGCSANCTLEFGYQCTGGDAYTADTCHEVCGDGYNLGTLECDDGNQYNSDGCDSSCNIELGYNCSYTGTGKSTCSETCGDGIMLGTFQCDDGNSINNDGCDAYCRVEECWDCDGLSPTVCKIDPAYTIGYGNASLATNQTLLTIEFNNSIVLQKGFDIYSAIQIDVVGPIAPYNVSWYLMKSDLIFNGMLTTEFNLELDWMDTQLTGDENLTVCMTNSSQFKHWKCTKFITDTPCWTFPLDGQEYPASYCSDTGITKFGAYAVMAQVGLGALFVTTGYSGGGAWGAVYMLQFINLIPVMSLIMPSCGLYFYKAYDWFNLQDSSIGSYVSQSLCTEDFTSDMKAPTYHFEKMGYSYRYFLKNFADIITMAGMLSLAIPAVAIIKTFLPTNNFTSKADEYVKGRFLIIIINFTYMKTCFLVFYNFLTFSPSTTNASVNSFASLAGLIYVGCVPIYYIFQMAMFKRSLGQLQKQLKNKGEDTAAIPSSAQEKAQKIKEGFQAKTLFEDYNTDSAFQYGYMMYFAFSRIAYGIILTYLYEQQDWQLFFLSVISAVNITWVAYFRPYKYPFRNALTILNEIALFYIFSSTAVWTRQDLFCDAQWRQFSSPISKNFTYYLCGQAFVWLGCQIHHFYTNRQKAKVEQTPSQSNPTLADPLKKPKEEFKEAESPKKKQEENVFTTLKDKSAKTQVEEDDSQMTETLRSNSQYDNSRSQEDSNDMDTVRMDDTNNRTQTYGEEQEDESEESNSLDRGSDTMNQTSQNETSNADQLRSVTMDEESLDEVPQSSFQNISR